MESENWSRGKARTCQKNQLNIWFIICIMEKKRVCCNCGNNIRVYTSKGVVTKCSIDNHIIGYVECFEHWCNRWRKNKHPGVAQ